MAVEVLNVRKAVEISWDKDALNGNKVEIICVNPDGGDVSTKRTNNDGKAVITFPEGYEGETRVTVVGAGSTEDWGMIVV